MKKSELKALMKPLVKECIHEVLLEEGLLSNVVSEVAKGLHASPIVESKQAPSAVNQVKESRMKLAEHRKKMIEAVGKDAYNGVDLFEGTNPMSNSEPSAGAPDLGAPQDAGVDISAFVGNASKIWQNMK